MDNFMDQLSKRLTSQELIRANAEADAQELKNMENQVTVLKEQMDKYDDCIQEMRQLNLRNIEGAQNVQSLAKQAEDSLGKAADTSIDSIQKTSTVSIEGIQKTSDASIEGIQKTSDASIAGINQTLAESLAKIAQIQDNSDKDSIEKINETVSGLLSKQDDTFKSLEDFLHTDNVKVYRNVQAAMIEELEKQTIELREQQEKSEKRLKLLVPLSIITVFIGLANLALLVVQVWGLLS